MTPLIIITVVGGVLYRLGGKKGFDTKFRDVGVSLCICLILVIYGHLDNLWQWLSLIPTFGLQWGALTTYRYFLKKPADYKWYHYALHGLMVSLAAFPFMLSANCPLMFSIRAVSCAFVVGFWSHFVSWDELEEWGRGIVLTGSTMLLTLGR